MTYLALLAAASVLLGDFVYVIYGLLDGDFALQFLLKPIVVVAVASGISLYFLSDIRRGDQQ